MLIIRRLANSLINLLTVFIYHQVLTNMNDVLFSDFTIKETPGDAIKVKDSHGVTFCDMATIWESVADSTNGAYGLYPVTSTSVLIDGCYVKGASDAGIYVGQSDTVIVRNTEAVGNVAGIEIENTSNADVYGNYAHDNTGGILVFDYPIYPKKMAALCVFLTTTW